MVEWNSYLSIFGIKPDSQNKFLGQPKQIKNLMKFSQNQNSRYVRAPIEMKYTSKMRSRIESDVRKLVT